MTTWIVISMCIATVAIILFLVWCFFEYKKLDVEEKSYSGKVESVEISKAKYKVDKPVVFVSRRRYEKPTTNTAEVLSMQCNDGQIEYNKSANYCI